MKWSIVFFLVLSCITSDAFSQGSGLDSAIRRLTETKDPLETEAMVDRIVRKYELDQEKDAETMDLLFGTAAVNFAMAGNYPRFEKYIERIGNAFNKTSFMNMAASKMLNDSLDAAYANRISKRTLKLYEELKDDPSARPADFPKKDWERFMDFAQYPYYDTHAQSLFALGEYEKALEYQAKAFKDGPENGLPSSVERYAELLELTGKREQAKQLLLKMASHGKLSKRMTEQLQSIYIAEKGSDKRLGAYLDSLQSIVQATLARELRSEILNETAPGFTLKDIYGNEVSLSDYAGRTVVLDLWATWCRPCIASFPAMQLMVDKHPEVTFLFIAVEEKDKDPLPKIRSFIEKKGYSFTVLIDEPVVPLSSRYKIISAYKPNGIPAKYIIDRNGILRFRTSGFDTDSELINELEAMFSILNSL